jgi:hypothetical protein
MKRIVISIAVAALTLPMLLAGPAAAIRDTGSGAEWTAADRAELAAYVATAQPLYAELLDCAACCDRLDIPSHRCAACDRTAACIDRVVARLQRVQAELASLDVPSTTVATDVQLTEAVTTMITSGEYMAAEVRTSPQDLLTAIWTPPPAERGGRRVVNVLSPDIVAQARAAALRAMGPGAMARTVWLRGRPLQSTESQQFVAGATPSEQARTNLALWREGIQTQVAAIGINTQRMLTR